MRVRRAHIHRRTPGSRAWLGQWLGNGSRRVGVAHQSTGARVRGFDSGWGMGRAGLGSLIGKWDVASDRIHRRVDSGWTGLSKPLAMSGSGWSLESLPGWFSNCLRKVMKMKRKRRNLNAPPKLGCAFNVARIKITQSSIRHKAVSGFEG